MAVFRRGKTWWYDFRMGGVRIRESTRATNRAAALQTEALRKAELALGRSGPEKREPPPRFVDFAYGEFARWCANEHKDRPSTYQRYMRSIKALVEFLGHRTLNFIDTGLVEKYKLHRSQQRRKNARDSRLVTPAAVNRDLATLRILFNFAVRLGLVGHNAVKGIRFLPENNHRMRVLSAEEESAYLVAASPLLRDIAIVILETGMRPGEVYCLRSSDVNPSQRYLSVRQGKTPFARRHIPLTKKVCEVLSARVAKVSFEWLFPCPWDETEPVKDVRKAHDAAVIRSGIQRRFRLYDLRHTALTRMAMAGIDLSTLKELAGHSQIQITMRYIHPTPEHKRRAIEQFEQYELALPGAGASDQLKGASDKPQF